MIYIDLEQDTAMGKFWKNATKSRNPQDVIDAVREWRENYMLRRKKNILQQQLPPLMRECLLVEPVPSELNVYLCFEHVFKMLIRELSSVADDNSQGGVFKRKELIRQLMSAASCCRQALIHPVLPREFVHHIIGFINATFICVVLKTEGKGPFASAVRGGISPERFAKRRRPA